MGAKVKWRKDRGAWFLYVYANGTQVAERYGPTLADKRKAERRAKRVIEIQRNGKLGLEKREKSVPFDEFAEKWLRAKVFLPMERGLEGHLSPKTASIRKQMVCLHLKPFFKDADIRGLNVEAIEDLWEYLLTKKHSRTKKDRHLSRRSLEIALGTLRLILADAVAKNIIPANAVDNWKAVQPKGRGSGRLKPVDRSKVLDSKEREDLLVAARREEPHYYPFILFMADTGVRISEALSVRWEGVDLELGIARVYRDKTGGQPTDLELTDRLRGVLRDLRASQVRALDGSVFLSPRGGPILHESFRRRVFNPLVKRVFEGKRHLTPHSLRHSWASVHMARMTPLKWIQEQGGWASAKMLLDVYGHFMPTEMGGFANALVGPDRTRPNQGGQAAQRKVAN